MRWLADGRFSQSVCFLTWAPVSQLFLALLVNSWTHLQEVSRRRRKSWIKSIFRFLCAQNVFSSPHKIQIAHMMADGLFWQCLSYFYGPWQCNLLCSQWDSHKPPGFHLKYLKLWSEDERSFYGLERHGDKWLMTKFTFWGGVSH